MIIPDLIYFAMLVTNGCVKTDPGTPIDLPKVLCDFHNALITFTNDPNNTTDVFVPDLWHVTKGRAAMFTKDDADVIWKTCVEITIELRARKWSEETCIENNYPGRKFHNDSKSVRGN